MVLKDPEELVWDRVEFVLILKKLRHDRDGGKAVFSGSLATLGIEDARANHSGKVLKIHLAARFFVDVGERRHPLEEHEEGFQRVAMRFGKDDGENV